jgi:hypothetical protein
MSNRCYCGNLLPGHPVCMRMYDTFMLQFIAYTVSDYTVVEQRLLHKGTTVFSNKYIAKESTDIYKCDRSSI